MSGGTGREVGEGSGRRIRFGEGSECEEHVCKAWAWAAEVRDARGGDNISSCVGWLIEQIVGLVR